MLPKKEEIRDKVVLVGLNSPVLREDSATEESMDELSALVETAGGETAGIVLQNRPAPDPRTFIGEGKVAEVQLYVENVGATMVIFDNDLSPSQQRVLTELLGIGVPNVYLGHLSEENNVPELAYSTVARMVEDFGAHVGRDVQIRMTYPNRAAEAFSL